PPIPLYFSKTKNTEHWTSYYQLTREWALKMQPKEGVKPGNEYNHLGPAFAKVLKSRKFTWGDLCNAFALHYWSSPDVEDGKIDECRALKLVGKYAGAMAWLVEFIE